MKKTTLFFALFSLTPLCADNTYLTLQSTVVGILAGGIAGTLSTAALQSDNPFPLVVGAVAGIAAGASYYSYYHPENRVYRLTRDYTNLANHPVVSLLVNVYDHVTGQIHVDTQQVIQRLSLMYVDHRNPLYDAVQNILALKAEAHALEQEATDLSTHYQSYAIASEFLISARILHSILLYVLAAIKSSPEYMKAVELQMSFNQIDMQATQLVELQQISHNQFIQTLQSQTQR